MGEDRRDGGFDGSDGGALGDGRIGASTGVSGWEGRAEDVVEALAEVAHAVGPSASREVRGGAAEVAAGERAEVVGPALGRREGSGAHAGPSPSDGGETGAGGDEAGGDEAGRAGPAKAEVDKADSGRAVPARRGGVDPVKSLMHRHSALCERAVDPLEIAAGLEAQGMTDRTAARYRHRDVFSLAEEMYARVPRGSETEQARTAAPGPIPSAPTGWPALALLPGAVCALGVVAVDVTDGQARIAAVLTAALAVAAALRAVLRYGPLHAPGRTAPATRAWTCWLLGYALLGDGLLAGATAGGPHGPWPLHTATVLGLALAVVPAAGCARFFAARAARRLALSRGLDEFAAAVRPLLAVGFGLFLCVLAGLLLVSGRLLDQSEGLVQGAALGSALLLARLLTVHGFPDSASRVLGAACAAEAIALAAVFAGRLPGCGVLARPVDLLTESWGAGAVPVLACGTATVVLFAHALRRLGRASAHAGAEAGR
ncbi:hypothetical protein [Streptomyces sp. YIM 130001]|uniref:hypothetical protein n=1 Tax=Streptomyces sp. YIM 130001 TaxID=2259644 RepID=UPI001F08B037|nr:hypothetical protein [Streptomyces sp. YIM 130001]